MIGERLRRELTRIMGIDPGTRVMGYGVIEERGGDLALIAFGVLTTPSRSPVVDRLRDLYKGAREVIVHYRPDVLAVEEPFVGEHVQAALAVGRAQAIAILAGANEGIPVFAYTPAQVKQRVANYGGSGKAQMQEMVRLQFGLPRAPEPSDAADALAVAICHFSESRLAAILQLGGEGVACRPARRTRVPRH